MTAPHQADVRCPVPTCRALPGDPCVSLQGNPRRVSHKSRRNALALATTWCQCCEAEQGQQCTGADGSPLQRIHQERRELFSSLAPPIRAAQPNIDFWLDKIHCGDVLDTLAAMPDECVDLVITSPPYNALQTTGGGWRHGLGKWGKAPLLKTGYDSHSDQMDPDDYVAWQQECLRAMTRVVKADGAILYNHRPRVQGDRYEDHARDIVSVAEEGGFALRQVILWDRGSGFNHNAGYFLPALRGDLPAGQAGQVPPPGPRSRPERLAGETGPAAWRTGAAGGSDQDTAGRPTAQLRRAAGGAGPVRRVGQRGGGRGTRGLAVRGDRHLRRLLSAGKKPGAGGAAPGRFARRYARRYATGRYARRYARRYATGRYATGRYATGRYATGRYATGRYARLVDRTRKLGEPGQGGL